MMHRWPRYGLRRVRVSKRVHVEVYERRDATGAGPCFSLYVDRVEQLRYDLFEPAHMHVRGEPDQPRHYFGTGLPLATCVARAIDDMERRFPSTVAVRSQLAVLISVISSNESVSLRSQRSTPPPPARVRRGTAS